MAPDPHCSSAHSSSSESLPLSLDASQIRLVAGSNAALAEVEAAFPTSNRFFKLTTARHLDVYKLPGKDQVFVEWGSEASQTQYTAEVELLLAAVVRAREILPELSGELRGFKITDETGYGFERGGVFVSVSLPQSLTRFSGRYGNASSAEQVEFYCGQFIHEGIHRLRDSTFDEGVSFSHDYMSLIEVPAHVAEFLVTPIKNRALITLIDQTLSNSDKKTDVYARAMSAAIAVIGSALCETNPRLRALVNGETPREKILSLVEIISEIDCTELEAIRPKLINAALKLPVEGIGAWVDSAFGALNIDFADKYPLSSSN